MSEKLPNGVAPELHDAIMQLPESLATRWYGEDIALRSNDHEALQYSVHGMAGPEADEAMNRYSAATDARMKWIMDPAALVSAVGFPVDGQGRIKLDPFAVSIDPRIMAWIMSAPLAEVAAFRAIASRCGSALLSFDCHLRDMFDEGISCFEPWTASAKDHLAEDREQGTELIAATSRRAEAAHLVMEAYYHACRVRVDGAKAIIEHRKELARVEAAHAASADGGPA